MKTLIAIPCFDTVHVEFVRSFMDLKKPEGTTFSFIPGTLIYEARNLIAQKAVENGFDRVLWLDSDMIIPPDALEVLAADMEEHNADLVTALYFRRKPPTNPVMSNDLYWHVNDDGNVETGATSYVDYPENAVFPIRGTGFGCCLTSRNLLRKMVEMYGSPFTPLMGMGEDFAFCWRADKAGFKMRCDSRVKCGHIGAYVYGEADFFRQTGKDTINPRKVCETCEYGRSDVCNDHGETIFNHKKHSCAEWRQRIRREYE